MEKTLQRFINFTNILNEKIGSSAAWFTTVLVIVVCMRVFGRLIFNSEPAWIQELEWHIFSLIFLLGAGYTLKHDKHVRVDLFYAKFSKKDKAFVNMVGAIVFLIPWCLIIIWASYHFALASYQTLEGSPDPNGLPYRFIIKFSITLGFVLLMLQSLALLAESILKYNSKSTEEN